MTVAACGTLRNHGARSYRKRGPKGGSAIAGPLQARIVAANVPPEHRDGTALSDGLAPLSTVRDGLGTNLGEIAGAGRPMPVTTNSTTEH